MTRSRALSATQRAQRRQDLLLAAALLRRQIDADLDRLAPVGERIVHWAEIGVWLRRHWPRLRGGKTVALAAAVGSLIGGTGWFALRRWRWIRDALVAWRLWTQWRRESRQPPA